MSQLNELIADFKKFRKTSATKHYPKELKERTVELLNEGVPRQELIEKLNIHPTTLSGWKNGRRNKEPSFSKAIIVDDNPVCLLYTSPSPRDTSSSRMPSSA